MRTEFSTAKSILVVLQYLGWLMIIMAVLAFFIGLSSQPAFPIVVSAVSSAVTGLLILLAASIATAQIATAEGVAELTRVTSDRLGEAVEHLRSIEAHLVVAAPAPQSATKTNQSEPRLSPSLPYVVQVYRGEEIEKRGAGYMAKGRVLPTIEEAREYIDKFKQTERG